VWRCPKEKETVLPGAGIARKMLRLPLALYKTTKPLLTKIDPINNILFPLDYLMKHRLPMTLVIELFQIA
jgi:hypothetical protein